MNISPKQAAEKLRVSTSHFRTLVKRFPEKFDIKKQGNGTKKIHFTVSNKSVLEFAKTYTHRNGAKVSKSESPISVFKNISNRIEYLTNKVEKLDKKVDTLIGMWQ